MKIKYAFADETVEIEVSEEWGNILIDLDRQEYNNDHAETRRHEPFLYVVCAPYVGLRIGSVLRPARGVGGHGHRAHVPWHHLPLAHSKGQLAERNQGKGVIGKAMFCLSASC